MSVRGKIEAVIYAAEEPVTLAQLAALFGEEALGETSGGPAEETASGELPETDPLPFAPEQDEAAAPEKPAQAEDAAPQPTLSDFDPAKREARARDRRARELIRGVLAELMSEYDASDRGMEIREIAGGYRIATKPEYHDAVRLFAKSLKPPMKLSLPALETLAVIAYKQPVTAPEVSEIRGVDSGGVLGSLISRKLVTTAGRKQVVGRPILYKTTKEFLLRFGLRDLHELPSMEEFEKMAGELEALGEEPGAGESAPLLPAGLAASGAPEHEPGVPVSAEAPELPGMDLGRGEEAAAGHGLGSAPDARQEASRAGEKPRLAPASIEVTLEEPEAPGLSVHQSGMPVRDAVSPEPEEES